MASAANPNGGLVLVAEDEPAIVRAISLALTRIGLRAIVAEDGAAGLEAFLAEPDAIDLVLADVVMPIMDGITMVREIRKVRPRIPVLFMSAYPERVVNSMKAAECALILKPFLIEELIRAVKSALPQREQHKAARAD